MGDYRAYILAIGGHRFVWAKDFLTNHPDDVAAVDAAKQLSPEHEVEVWEGCRLVARLCCGEEEKSPGLVPHLLSTCDKDVVGRAEPISSSKVSELASVTSSITFETSDDSPGGASKPDLGPAGWRRFLISWSKKHEPNT
jgi:hypothetical protein